MEIKIYGTRGSIPVSRPGTKKYGGNTTCLEIRSRCLPDKVALAVDAGSGFKEMSKDLLEKGVMEVWLVFTHWHHDHTQGLPLAGHLHNPEAAISIWGPEEHGIGPKEVMEGIMKPPYFPVDFKTLKHRFSLKSLENIGTQIMLIHPKGGAALMATHTFLAHEESKTKQVSFGRGKFSISESLVIKMHRTVHPEYTVSYRFEERPTGKVAVILTDHENTDGLPTKLVSHIHGADLLIQDCQYSREVYDRFTSGFGHGTPDYCARLAQAAHVKILAITHHDPGADDDEVEARLAEVKKALNSSPGIKILACADYQKLSV